MSQAPESSKPSRTPPPRTPPSRKPLEQPSRQPLAKKPLLVFAHKREADFFFNNFPLTLVSDFPLFYRGDSFFLMVLNGKGFELVRGYSIFFERISRALLPQTSEVINLGLVASVDHDLPLFSVHRVRNVYAYLESDFIKKSFTLKPVPENPLEKTLESHDVLTLPFPLLTTPVTTSNLKANKDNLPNRILPGEISPEEILPFAPLVDMELWYLAYVVKDYDIPLSSYKIVSDHGNYQSSSQAHKNIVSQAKLFSQTLGEKFIQIYFPEIAKGSKKDLEESSLQDSLLQKINDNFYFTKTSKQIFLKEFLSLKAEPMSQLNSSLEKIIAQKTSAKNKTKELLNYLEKLMGKNTSYLKRFLKKIDAAISETTQGSGIKLDITCLEKKELTLSYKASSLEEIKKKSQASLKIDFERIYNLMEGQEESQGGGQEESQGETQAAKQLGEEKTRSRKNRK